MKKKKSKEWYFNICDALFEILLLREIYLIWAKKTLIDNSLKNQIYYTVLFIIFLLAMTVIFLHDFEKHMNKQGFTLEGDGILKQPEKGNEVKINDRH